MVQDRKNVPHNEEQEPEVNSAPPVDETEDTGAASEPSPVETSAQAPEASGESAAVEGSEQEGASALEEQLAAEKARAEGYLEELKRERASFINYRRRTDQEKLAWARDATATLILNILPVLDDFERARAAIPEEDKGSSWVEGITAIERKLYSTLEPAGLKQIEAVGKEFDPNLHEAVSIEPDSEHEHSTVVEEYRKGYLLGERVLRPSMVKVAQ